MARPFQGALPEGASVTSGTISGTGAISAGGVTINTVALPAVGAAASAAARCDQMVDAVNFMSGVTRVFAEKVTATTFRLWSRENIVVAALAGGATTANCGLTAGTTNYSAPAINATRKQFGTDVTPTDADIVKLGGQEITVAAMKKMGRMERIGSNDAYIRAPQTPTRTDA